MTYTARVCNNTRRPTRQQMQVCARMSVTIDPIGGGDTIDQLLRQVPHT